jgi:regulatory protein
MRKIAKYISKDEALSLLQKYCAYQDRCHQEVRTKLLSYKIYGDDLEDIITQLIQEKYLDELRYATSFVRGKARIKKWGPIKIRQLLKQKEISDYCQRKAFEELDDEIFLENTNYWLQRKANDYQKDSDYIKKQKIIKFLISKGFEYSMIQGSLKDQ